MPLTSELRSVIGRTPDIAPAFILTEKGKPFKAASLGNQFGHASLSEVERYTRAADRERMVKLLVGMV